jgi:hypothetical protein
VDRSPATSRTGRIILALIRAQFTLSDPERFVERSFLLGELEVLCIVDGTLPAIGTYYYGTRSPGRACPWYGTLVLYYTVY